MNLRLWRPTTFLIAGVLVAFTLFLLMNELISGQSTQGGAKGAGQIVDMVRLDDPEELRIKQRARPKKPPPPKEPPPPPKLKVPNEQKPPRNLTRINMPRIDIPVGDGGGPYLGDWGAGPASAEGDAVPIVRIEPQWPRQALMEGLEGYVRVEILISTDGSVKDVRVLESKPGPVFVRDTIRAVRRWKFKPRIVDGTAIERLAVTTIEFELSE